MKNLIDTARSEYTSKVGNRTFRKPRTAVSFIFSLVVISSEKKHVMSLERVWKT